MARMRPVARWRSWLATWASSSRTLIARSSPAASAPRWSSGRATWACGAMTCTGPWTPPWPRWGWPRRRAPTPTTWAPRAGSCWRWPRCSPCGRRCWCWTSRPPARTWPGCSGCATPCVRRVTPDAPSSPSATTWSSWPPSSSAWWSWAAAGSWPTARPAEVFAPSGWELLRSTYLEPPLAARVGDRLGLGSTPTEAALLSALDGSAAQ